jgi:hypothetical protein
MLSAIKDAIGAIALIVTVAYSTGHREWLWNQIAILRVEAIRNSKVDWGCPSIFRKNACVSRD